MNLFFMDREATAKQKYFNKSFHLPIALLKLVSSACYSLLLRKTSTKTFLDKFPERQISLTTQKPIITHYCNDLYPALQTTSYLTTLEIQFQHFNWLIWNNILKLLYFSRTIFRVSGVFFHQESAEKFKNVFVTCDTCQ